MMGAGKERETINNRHTFSCKESCLWHIHGNTSCMNMVQKSKNSKQKGKAFQELWSSHERKKSEYLKTMNQVSGASEESNDQSVKSNKGSFAYFKTRMLQIFLFHVYEYFTVVNW